MCVHEREHARTHTPSHLRITETHQYPTGRVRPPSESRQRNMLTLFFGGSQARGRIGAAAAGLRHSHTMPQPQQRWIRAAAVTYTTAHGNAGSLTH